MYRHSGVSRGVGEELISDPSPGGYDYCEIQPGMCITREAKDYLATLNCRTASARGYSRGGLRGLGRMAGLGRICSLYTGNQINRGMLNISNLFNLCALKNANLPICPPPPPPPVTTFDEPTPPPVEEEDNMLMIGGILAVLVVGGVGYAVFKNRKKFKGKKKR